MEPFPRRTSETLALQGQLLQEAHSLSPRRGHSNDSKANKLQAILDTAVDSLREIKQSVEVAKELLVDTESKLVSLESQVTEMKTTVDEIRSHKRSSGMSQVGNRSPTSSQETSRGKRLKANPGGSDPYQPSCSQGETSQFQSTVSQNLTDVNYPLDEPWDQLKAICSDMTYNEAEIVTRSAQEARGILSTQDFLTFLYLSRQVDDPVQLSRVSFTEHTTPLYHQLMTFAYNLKKANRAAQGAASQIDTSLEDKFQSLVDAFRLHMPEDE